MKKGILFLLILSLPVLSLSFRSHAAADFATRSLRTQAAETEAAETEEKAAQVPEERRVPVYCSSLQDLRNAVDQVLLDDFPLFYMDGVNDLPYVNLSDFVMLMNRVDASDRSAASGDAAQKKEAYTFRADDNEGLFTCTYEPQHSDVIMDFVHGTLTYTCMDTFGKDPAFSPFEIQTNPLDYLKRLDHSGMDRLGEERVVCLADYGIPMLMTNGMYLLPLHTAFDFLIWTVKSPSKVLCCSEEAVFIGPDQMFGYEDAPSELGQIYFSAKPAARSEALAEYGYEELCLMLDCFYGLKEAHHIGSFRTFLRQNGYEKGLLSQDPKEADQALSDLITYVLDDSHSAYGLSSWMSGRGFMPSSAGSGFSAALYEKKMEVFEQAASDQFPNGIDFYTESGNTAYITIPLLVTQADSDRFYSLDPADRSAAEPDPVLQILYAHHMINRDNSPIENVVLDLSLSPGGDINTAACLLSWFLGEGYVTIANSFSRGLGISRYRADLNRDHQFTQEDSLTGKKRLFCLISPVTFSSANMTAAMLKNSGFVTILGQQSAGGSGMKTPASSAWDSLFHLSGFRSVVTVKNGSWYDADPGVAPDVFISDPALFYDREKLTSLINSIMS